jgi:hypothetical protein
MSARPANVGVNGRDKTAEQTHTVEPIYPRPRNSGGTAATHRHCTSNTGKRRTTPRRPGAQPKPANLNLGDLRLSQVIFGLGKPATRKIVTMGHTVPPDHRNGPLCPPFRLTRPPSRRFGRTTTLPDCGNGHLCPPFRSTRTIVSPLRWDHCPTGPQERPTRPPFPRKRKTNCHTDRTTVPSGQQAPLSRSIGRATTPSDPG